MAFYGYASIPVRLLVGPDKTELHAHKDVLTQLPFFRSCLGGDFSEASKKVIELPEDDPEGLAGLLNYFYTSHIAPITANESTEIDNIEILRQTKIYVNAHKYGAEALMNTITDHIVRYYSTNIVTPVSIPVLTHANLHNCPLRKFLIAEVAAFLVGGASYDYDYDEADINHAFREVFDNNVMRLEPCDTRDVLGECLELQLSKEDGSARYDRCIWHQHKITPACSKSTGKRKRVAAGNDDNSHR